MTSVLDQAIEAQRNNVVFPIPRPTDGSQAYRVEIDEFLADNAMTNLFLIALRELQDEALSTPGPDGKPVPTWWTFHSLSGIHGRPAEWWAGIENGGEGYCHHGAPTFPTWHRPYMFQFEQAIWTKMNQNAAKYPADYKETYTSAAARFRLPFWDPVMPRHRDDSQASAEAKKAGTWFFGVPVILKTPEVWVRFPESPDELQSIPNPLYSYKFPSADDFKESGREWIDWEKDTVQGWKVDENYDPVPGTFNPDSPGLIYTTRTPTDKPKIKGDSDYETFEKNLQATAGSLAVYVWQLLSPVVDDKGKPSRANAARTWEIFSNHNARLTTPQDDKRDERLFGKDWINWARSLESWHDNLHMLIATGEGYAGHMGDPSISAFDPIFWLHHNNIERMLCIYQALYPDRYVEAGKKAQMPPRYYINDDGKKVLDGRLYGDDELYPFLKDSKACFTSNNVRDWTKSGYATPGDADVPGLKEKLQEYLLVNYYWATVAGQKPNFEKMNYPKDLTHVEALTGNPEPVVVAPLSIQAISQEAGQASLVFRQVATSETREATDETFASEMVSQSLAMTESSYPLEALLDADKKDVQTKMVTWNAYFRIKKYAFNGPFNIHFFVGDIENARPAKYMHRMNEAGFSGIFVPRSTAACSNCEGNKENDMIYSDVVPLTNILIDYLDVTPGSDQLIEGDENTTLADLSEQSVVPFLKKNLKWRFQSLTGQALDYSPDLGLEVAVAERIFIPPFAGHLLGLYSVQRVHADITAGKRGGYSGEDYDVVERDDE